MIVMICEICLYFEGWIQRFRDDCDDLDDHVKLLSIWTGGSAHYQCNEDGIMMILGAKGDCQEWFYLKACLCWIASKGWLLTHFKHFNSRNYVMLLFSEFSSRMFFLCQDIIQQPAPYLSVSIYTFAGKDIMQRYKVKYNPKHCQQRYDANYN